MPKPLVSVIIPTLLRTPYAIQTVKDLLVQDYPDLEVIVVEQEQSSPELVAFAQENRERVQYYFHEKSTGPRNKNIGVSHAKGEVFLFLDDDCRLPHNFVSQSVEVLLSDPKVGAVSGKIIQPSEPIPLETEGVVGRVKKYGAVVTNYGSNTRALMDTAHGCSMYRREAFEKAGGFDENFDGNAMREESDLSMRVGRAGYVMIFEPRIEFIHLKAPMGGTRRKTDRMQWYFDFFHNDLLFFLKNRQWRYLPIFFASKARPILACMFYYGKGHPRALVLPVRAYAAAFRTYRKEKAEGKI